MDLILRNARRIGAEHELTDIGIAGGHVAAIEPGLAAEGETIDLGGRLVSPGFVETHIHLDKSCILDRCRSQRGDLEEAIAEAAKATAAAGRRGAAACRTQLRAHAAADCRRRLRFRRSRSQRGAGRSGGPSQSDVHHHRHIQVYTGDPAAWSGIFRVLQGSEIWRRRGAWIDAHKPSFGPGIAERFRWTRTIDPAEAERMRLQREGVARHLADLLDGG